MQFCLEDWDRLGREVSCLVDLMPSGRFLMEDFYYAGGLPAVLRELGDLIHRDALTVTGRTMGELIADAPCYNREVIRSRETPVVPDSGIAVLKRQPQPGRRDHQAGRSQPTPAAPHRPGDGLRAHRRLLCAHRRPGPGRGCRQRARAQAVWPSRVPGDARGGQHAVAAQAARVRASPTWCASRTPACPARPTAPWSCTSPPKPPSAGRSPWYRPVTSSNSTSRPDVWRCSWTTPNWPGAAPSGRRRRRLSSAATSSSTSSTSRKPTKAPTSTSCKGGSGSAVPRHSH